VDFQLDVFKDFLGVFQLFEVFDFLGFVDSLGYLILGIFDVVAV
jgi:hypothetical protein